MSTLADVVIVGGGVIGASIAFHLTAGGAGRVVLCEQGLAGGEGATAKSGGLIRMHHSSPWHVRLAWESHPVFAEWPQRVGGTCGFRTTGFGLVVGPAHVDHLRRNVETMRALGIPALVLSPEAFVDLQPACDAEGVGAVAYEPLGGYADPALATRAWLRRAQQRGLRLMEGVRVDGLATARGRVTGVETTLGPIEAGVVVVAANAWATGLLRPLGIDVPLRSRRIGICFLEWSPGPGPPLWTYIDDVTGTYFRPDGGGRVLAGVAVDEWDVDLEARPPLPTARQIDEARGRAGRRVPALLGASPVGTRIGFDGYTPDQAPIIGVPEAAAGLYLALGFSGGGFKLAPAVGRAVAGEILSGRPDPELEAVRPERFARQALIHPEFAYVHL